MSIYLCVKCGRWHETQAEMKKCKHSDPVVVPAAPAGAADLRDNSSADDVRAVADELGIPYTNKRDTLAAIREATDAQ